MRPHGPPCVGGLLAGAAGLLMVLGCQPVPKAEPSTTQAGLIGKTKQELLACAGAPTHETIADTMATLTYYKRASPLEHFFSATRSGVACPRRGCEATVTLKDDRVMSVQYRAEPEALDGCETCDAIFADCLR
ncbi:MAG: hypothetical protein KGO52_09900 [Nitrospirota bacterium]|nr:hypothetical protein [Nitrospirota bacterium]MDE3034459.1 hypothetical protein [Nitrospirota bacterium]MDE3119035.1 hypothetical protein [Nitrospirota bacterium]MDE3224793.1 hypothetical protein [Nitrospirota bacterium]MDE3243018.1 hypothetical protein [Nitrospirota bacterium]